MPWKEQRPLSLWFCALSSLCLACRVMAQASFPSLIAEDETVTRPGSLRPHLQLSQSRLSTSAGGRNEPTAWGHEEET